MNPGTIMPMPVGTSTTGINMVNEFHLDFTDVAAWINGVVEMCGVPGIPFETQGDTIRLYANWIFYGDGYYDLLPDPLMTHLCIHNVREDLKLWINRTLEGIVGGRIYNAIGGISKEVTYWTEPTSVFTMMVKVIPLQSLDPMEQQEAFDKYTKEILGLELDRQW